MRASSHAFGRIPPIRTAGAPALLGAGRRSFVAGARHRAVEDHEVQGRSGRSYSDAIAALNTLQTNASIVKAIRDSGKGMNTQAIPEMIEWCRRAGYKPSDFDRLNVIHIAGTKGKGSTSAFISSILSQYLSDGASLPRLRKIGLYTSPHLRFVRERIQINNQPLSEELFARYFHEVWDTLEASAKEAGITSTTDTSTKPVYFRYLTITALHAYIQEGVDTAVVEAGVGGEYDSTNILEHPTVTGITSLGIDHVAMLGDTIEKIAWHKAGIMKPGAKAFTVPQPASAMEVLFSRAREKQVDLQIVDIHPDLVDKENPVKLGLAADFQKVNASLAIAVAAAHLRILGYNDVPTDIMASRLPPQFRRGLEQTRWTGRCETRKEGNITWCLDGGHTLESIELTGKWFAEQLTTPVTIPAKTSSNRPPIRVLIFNQQTRDADALARALHRTLSTSLSSPSPSPSPSPSNLTPPTAPFTHAVFCSNVTYSSSSGRGGPAGYRPDLVSINTDDADVRALTVQKALAATWRDIEKGGGAEVKVLRTIEDAVGWVRELAGKEEEAEVVVLVTGSLHLVGGALDVLESTG